MAVRVLEKERIYPGDVVRLTISVTDPDDGTTAVDPVGLTVSVRNADGPVTTYVYGTDAEIVRSAVGSYYIDIQPDAAREWYVKVDSDTPDDVDEYWFAVEASAF